MIPVYEVPYGYIVHRDGKVSERTRWKVSPISSLSSKGRRELKPIEDAEGFLMVHFGLTLRGGKQYVHRLVAEKFIPNPEGYEHVIFKDGNPKNCNADNLEWCS